MKGLLGLVLSAVVVAAQDCKCLPGDSCWPSISRWEALNSTVGGRLVATVPLGSPCHDPNYDSEKCDYLQSEWQYAGIQ